MTAKQKKVLYRIIAAGVLLIAAALLPFEERSIPRLIAFLVPYGIIGWDVLWKAVRNISHGQVFDENFLMCVATIGALFVGEYPEAAAVMLFYQIGELFQGVAVGRSRQSISDLMNICPEYANIERDGQIEEVDPAEVETDSIIVIKPGERIPLDGIVTEGTSNIDTAALTGESLPRSVKVGDEVISGCINQSGLLKVRVTKECEDSTVTRQKSQKRELHHKVCQILHPLRGVRSIGARTAPSPDNRRQLGDVDTPCADIPGHLLPLCAGHFSTTELFRRYRRCQQTWYTGKGRQLS